MATYDVLKFYSEFQDTNYFYKKKDIRKLTKYIYFEDLIMTKGLTWIEKAGYRYLIIHEKYPTINDNHIFIEIFYKYYAPSLKNEIQEKYDIDISLKFNFEELYLFLKKKGYVKEYYTKIINDIKKKADEYNALSETKEEQNNLKIGYKSILKMSVPFKIDKKIIKMLEEDKLYMANNKIIKTLKNISKKHK